MDFGWLAGVILLVSGIELWQDITDLSYDSDESPIDTAELEQRESSKGKRFFERGTFYRSEEGYLISNLSPVPEQELVVGHQPAEGCDVPVLVSDLSIKRQDKKMSVTEVDALFDCEI